MSSQAVEFAYFPISPSNNLDDKNDPGHALWQDSLKAISEQPGFKELYWGRIIEKPEVVQLVVVWESLQAHKDFIASPQYGPLSEKLGKLIVPGPGTSLYHIAFEPTDISFFGTSGATEVVTYYAPSESFLGNTKKFKDNIAATKPKGFHGAAVGESFEDDLSKEGGEKKGKAVVLAIGWDSKDAHMAFRETPAFTENVSLIREGAGDVTVHHTVFKKY